MNDWINGWMVAVKIVYKRQMTRVEFRVWIASQTLTQRAFLFKCEKLYDVLLRY